MRILITGGFGFVGGRLAVHLEQAGHRIVLGSRKNLTAPTWLPQAEVAQIAWDDAAALECSCSNVDLVIQAAGMNAQECALDPVAALTLNGLATASLMAAANRAGTKRFIYLSTAHVYSNPLVGTITEETCPRNMHPYATSHLAGEYAVMSASQRGRTQGIILRLSNAFGAPAHKDVNCWMLLINDLCRQAVESRKLCLQTSGLQQRNFIPLATVCRVIEQLMNFGGSFRDISTFNLGASSSKSVLEMAQIIGQRCAEVLGFEPILQRAGRQENELDDSLIYRSERLAKMSIDHPCTDMSAEIDNLLRFCNRVFTKA